MLIDLQKAYDSVDRELLWKILLRRCKNNDEETLVQLMMKLHRESTISIRFERINAEMRLPQGSILSPVLFNLYLERGDLLAFADDMLVMSNNKNELSKIIDELESLKEQWNLRLNKKKSEILTKEKLDEINGVKCAT